MVPLGGRHVRQGKGTWGFVLVGRRDGNEYVTGENLVTGVGVRFKMVWLRRTDSDSRIITVGGLGGEESNRVESGSMCDS